MDVGDVLDRTIPYIGADAGVSHLLKYKLHPTLAIGDFDSLCDLEILDDLKIKKYPSRKDQTDTQLALEYAINKGYDEIDIYGVTGGRIDHFFSIMCLLEQYKDLDIRVIDATNIISILKTKDKGGCNYDSRYKRSSNNHRIHDRCQNVSTESKLRRMC